jgi:hypothetical protein
MTDKKERYTAIMQGNGRARIVDTEKVDGDVFCDNIMAEPITDFLNQPPVANDMTELGGESHYDRLIRQGEAMRSHLFKQYSHTNGAVMIQELLDEVRRLHNRPSAVDGELIEKLRTVTNCGPGLMNEKEQIAHLKGLCKQAAVALTEILWLGYAGREE